MMTILIMLGQLFLPASEHLKGKYNLVSWLPYQITKPFDKRFMFHIPGEPFKREHPGRFCSCSNQNVLFMQKSKLSSIVKYFKKSIQ